MGMFCPKWCAEELFASRDVNVASICHNVSAAICVKLSLRWPLKSFCGRRYVGRFGEYYFNTGLHRHLHACAAGAFVILTIFRTVEMAMALLTNMSVT